MWTCVYMYIYNVYYKLHIVWGFPIALLVKNLLAVPEIWVRCLGGEYPLEKEMAIHSSILAWETAWTGDNPWDHIESEMTVLHAAALFCILPYSTYQGLESDFSFFFFKGKNVWCFKKAAKKTPY